MGLQGRHKSLDKDAKKSIRWLESQPMVKKVILGISEACRHKYAPGDLRIKSIQEGGLYLNSYSGIGVTNVFVGVTEVELIPELINIIKQKFDTFSHLC